MFSSYDKLRRTFKSISQQNMAYAYSPIRARACSLNIWIYFRKPPWLAQLSTHLFHSGGPRTGDSKNRAFMEWCIVYECHTAAICFSLFVDSWLIKVGKSRRRVTTIKMSRWQFTARVKEGRCVRVWLHVQTERPSYAYKKTTHVQWAWVLIKHSPVYHSNSGHGVHTTAQWGRSINKERNEEYWSEVIQIILKNTVRSRES